MKYENGLHYLIINLSRYINEYKEKISKKEYIIISNEIKELKKIRKDIIVSNK